MVRFRSPIAAPRLGAVYHHVKTLRFRVWRSRHGDIQDDASAAILEVFDTRPRGCKSRPGFAVPDFGPPRKTRVSVSVALAVYCDAGRGFAGLHIDGVGGHFNVRRSRIAGPSRGIVDGGPRKPHRSARQWAERSARRSVQRSARQWARPRSQGPDSRAHAAWALPRLTAGAGVGAGS